MVATPHRGGCEAQSLALGSPVTLAAPRGPAHRQPLIVPGAAGQSAPPPATGRDTFASPKLRTHHARRLGRSRRLSIDGNVAGVRRAAPPTGRDAGSLASVLRHRLVVVDVSAQAGKQRLLQARSTIAKKAAAVKRNKLARDALGRPGGARAARARARLYTYVARPNAGALAVPAGITLAHDMLTDDDGDIAHEFFVVLARAAACPPRHARTCGETCIHSAFTFSKDSRQKTPRHDALRMRAPLRARRRVNAGARPGCHPAQCQTCQAALSRASRCGGRVSGHAPRLPSGTFAMCSIVGCLPDLFAVHLLQA